MREAFPSQTGLLVVEQVIPSMGATSFLQPGDIVLSVDNDLVVNFVPLAATLDNRVGNQLMVEIECGSLC